MIGWKQAEKDVASNPALYQAFDRQNEERSVAAIAEAIEKRHAAYVHDDVNEEELGRTGIAQQAQQPSVQDPKLWTVKCTPGTEKQLITQLMHETMISKKYFLVRQFRTNSCKFVHKKLKGNLSVEVKAVWFFRDFLSEQLLPSSNQSSCPVWNNVNKDLDQIVRDQGKSPMIKLLFKQNFIFKNIGIL